MSKTLPSNWVMSSIAEVTKNIEQREPKGSMPFTYIDISAVDRETKKIVFAQILDPSNAPSRARKVVKTGDVLVSMTRPNLNAVAMVEKNLDSEIASTGFDVLRSAEIDPRWLYFSVRSPAFVAAMTDLVQGALYPAIKSTDVRRYEIPLAPLPEQKRIADKLDTVLARVDACRERLNRVPLILKRFRQSVLAAATCGKLTADWRGEKIAGSFPVIYESGQISIPEYWTVCPLHELLSPSRPLCYGVVQPGDENQGGVPLIRVQDMENGTVSVDGLRTVSAKVDQEYKRSRVKAGDLLISVVGTIGRIAIVPEGFDGNIARAIARIAPGIKTSASWLNIWLSSDAVQWWLLSNSREVARKTLNLSQLAETKVALPSLTEQNEIVRRVEILFAFADRLEARLTTARAAADRLTPALLAKAFRGELVPQDPNDEPAAELLKRLAATRNETGAKQPRGRAAKTKEHRETAQAK